MFNLDQSVIVDKFPNYRVDINGAVSRGPWFERELKHARNREGVSFVTLYSEPVDGQPGVRHIRSVARLVAETFLDPPHHPAFDTPTHRNGDRSDCRASNLVWRPRWFAINFHRQWYDGWSEQVAPFHNVTTGRAYKSLRECAEEEVVLMEDVFRHLMMVRTGSQEELWNLAVIPHNYRYIFDHKM